MRCAAAPLIVRRALVGDYQRGRFGRLDGKLRSAASDPDPAIHHPAKERPVRTGAAIRAAGSGRAAIARSRPFGGSARNPETGCSGNPQQSRFSMSNGPFREHFIGNRFRENDLSRRIGAADPTRLSRCTFLYGKGPCHRTDLQLGEELRSRRPRLLEQVHIGFSPS